MNKPAPLFCSHCGALITKNHVTNPRDAVPEDIDQLVEYTYTIEGDDKDTIKAWIYYCSAECLYTDVSSGDAE